MRKIREEFANSGNLYLCHASEVFEAIWSEHKDTIAKFAKEFSDLAVDPPGSNPTTGGERVVLFYGTGKEGREIRLAFLDSEIAKKTKKAKKK